MSGVAAGPGAGIVPADNVREFFRESVEQAVSNQRVEAGDHTVAYVVNLLTLFTRADELYPDGAPMRGLPALAKLLRAAVDSDDPAVQARVLQRLGDLALFIAGFFPDALARRPVDVDYYVRMGGGAYGTLAERVRGSRRGRALGPVFEELGEKFPIFVDVIGEVSDTGRVHTQADILRIYEVWVKTGSARLGRKLGELGIQPPAASVSRAHH